MRQPLACCGSDLFTDCHGAIRCISVRPFFAWAPVIWLEEVLQKCANGGPFDHAFAPMNILRRFLCFSLFAYAAIGFAAASEAPSPANFVMELGPPPTAPAVPKMATAAALQASGQPGFTNFLNITNRENSREFFNLVFGASENVPMDWSGNFPGCVPGTNSATYLEAVARRVNYFRAMAGVPSSITLSNEFTRKAQLAA